MALDHLGNGHGAGCAELVSRWEARSGDPVVLAVVDGDEHDEEVTALLALPNGVGDRLVAGVAIAWADRQASEVTRAAPPALVSAVGRRARDVFEEWWGDEVDVVVDPAADGAVVEEHGESVRVTVGVAWLADVWCRGLALLGEDYFVLGVKAVAEDRLVVDALDANLDDLEIDVALPLVPLRTSPPEPPFPAISLALASAEAGTPLWSTKLYVYPDYGQLYICTGSSELWPDALLLREAAHRDATESRRFVGVADGALIAIDVVCGGRPWTRVFVEVWPGEPPDDGTEWDHEVDLDLDVTAGLGLSGCINDGPYCPDVPPGQYRARVAGGNFARAAARSGAEVYRLRLWPRTGADEPRLRRSWPGWEAHRPRR